MNPADIDCEQLIGLPTLMKMAFSGVDLTPLGTRLLERAAIHEDDADTLMNLCMILQLLGKRELGLAMQSEALKLKQLYHRPAATRAAVIRLLAIMGAGDLMANTPLEFLVEDSDIALDMLYVDAGLPFPSTIPEHDLAIVAVGESDDNQPLLHHIDQAMAAWPRPLLNRAAAIAALTRDGVCAMLQGATGIVAPQTARVRRERMDQLACGEILPSQTLPQCGYPVIVRPVGSHAGHGLEKLDSPGAIGAYLATMPDQEFFLAPFVDYSSPDGLYRKYRVVLIDGRPYAAHLAVSPRWIVHYLNADMLENARNRELEARFMADFECDFAPRHEMAFRALHERSGLDYLVIDCAETRDGSLLVFEIDTSAVVHAMDPVDMFPYKGPQMRKVFAAFRDMLARRLGRPDQNSAIT